MSAERGGGISAATATLIGLVIGALIGAMVAMPLANNARQRNAYPRAIMNIMERDYDQLFDLAAADQCSQPRFDQRLRRLRSLAEDTPSAFGAVEDADFIAANEKLLSALERSAAAHDCGLAGVALEQVDRACEACHSSYR